MKKNIITAIVISILSFTKSSANYISYFSGSSADVTTTTSGGVVLMGGAGEHDNAMRWFLQHSGGGDIVVLRADKSNGYNSYLYTQLGVTVNSVETLVCPDSASANDPYVLQQIANAEAIWFAGGDQYDYISFWRNGQGQTIFNNLVNVKQIPFGGISAGMAIQGQTYFTAQNGTITSSQCLANPYNSKIILGHDDFLQNRYMNNVITDTHFDNPSRKGRIITFLARMVTDYSVDGFAIACNEYTAVCIDTNGIASVFGDYPANQDFAYFLRSNCIAPIGPENCSLGMPLNWNRNGAAVKCYKVGGDDTGTKFLDLNTWNTGSGGTWEDWYVDNGAMFITPGALPPSCATTTALPDDFETKKTTQLFPNPSSGVFNFVETISNDFEVAVYDFSGKCLFSKIREPKVDLSMYPDGVYFIKMKNDNAVRFVKAIKLN